MVTSLPLMTAYDREIGGAEFDRAEAKQALDEATDLADEIIDNPIADPANKLRLIVEYGQGDRDFDVVDASHWTISPNLANPVDTCNHLSTPW